MSRRRAAAPDGVKEYPRFTKQMRATHKLLVPQMAPIHFTMIVDVLRQKGYDVEILENDGPNVVHEGRSTCTTTRATRLCSSSASLSTR